MRTLLKELITDRAALFGIATKAGQGAAGLITAIFIVRYFSPAIQGYYYTFANLLALQIFLELGLSGVITTFAAHEWAKLSLNREGVLQGSPHALSRLKSLSHKVAKWYAIGGVILLLMLVAVGIWFFSAQAGSDTVSWKYPWLAMCLVATVNFMLTPLWALLTGCGQMATLNAYRLADTAIRYGFLWLCMVLGASLWSAVGAMTASTVAGCAFLFIRYRRFFGTLLTPAAGAELNWLRELAPLQLRIAVSWISGYFAFSVFVPVVFHFHGAEDAGRMGMTWALTIGISGIAATWLQVQAPKFSVMVARREFETLDRAALRTAAIAIAVFVLGGGIALGGLFSLAAYRPDIATRLFPVGCVALFLFAELLQQISMVQSTYLRAFKQEPFVGVSVISGIVIGAGTLVLTPLLGSYGPAVSYLLGVISALVWGTAIFVSRRKQWTSP
jgi:O-antigen/teichoic acid export membrane protein